MKTIHRITLIGTVTVLTALAGCVWEPGMRGERGRDHDRQGSYSQQDNRDRDGRPCDPQRDEHDARHNDDCRPYRR